MIQPFWNLHAGRDGVSHRRGFLKQLCAGAVGGTIALSWRDMMIAQADELRKRGKSMILLWMDGGPSQFETFNPKIGSPNQGPSGDIATNLPGVRISEHMPHTAQVMDKIALIRSMHSTERDHFRAIKLVRTGYPINPSIPYPTWGSVVARDRWDSSYALPAFVRIGAPRIKTRDVDAGVLGPRYDSFKIDVAGELPPDVIPTVDPQRLQRRLALSAKFDQQFASTGGANRVHEKEEIYQRTSRFVLSPKLDVFKLDDEPDQLRDQYTRTNFGQGCLLARRLVERGASFIEVFSTGSTSDQGWDTHKNGWKENPHLAGEIDQAYATLLRDLEQRGMLEDTLVVWMGEFGRTPKFKPDGGREHYSDGWITCLSGGGVKTGQVIGATDKDGVHVSERPVGVQDLFVTFCKILGMDPHEEYVTDQDQPLALVKGGELIHELF
ncbi:DUF1501 domain-containing protein [Blastopirellula sp. JC732]|uniref:DUF1501 domain-containing protein n=1 Tax=Blastopirellula sediminis TaxID=2894196 RepID=A0A9X1MQH9_9BACT|nr:DUF1501 domain-containing protein [Blastopirellula sediminis]MCC9606530.1 DUF1501 domain-containing protein [Blastopirellula sediminis]MCC9630172.1 DUF1501 domain-containing protein [Blastopirellula sediminis]